MEEQTPLQQVLTAFNEKIHANEQEIIKLKIAFLELQLAFNDLKAQNAELQQYDARLLRER